MNDNKAPVANPEEAAQAMIDSMVKAAALHIHAKSLAPNQIFNAMFAATMILMGFIAHDNTGKEKLIEIMNEEAEDFFGRFDQKTCRAYLYEIVAKNRKDFQNAV